MAEDKAVVVATVGTDHHPFPRLIEWIDSYATRRPEVRCVVQHGQSARPRVAEAVAMLAREDLLALLRTATAVVCQAGPGSVLDARAVGVLPVAVPRLRQHGEVVDDHQVAFADAMASRGEVLLARTETELHAALDAALAHPGSVRRPPRPSPAPETAARVASALEDVLRRPPGVISLSRCRQVLRRPAG